jgi:hypothetical protein
MLLDAEERAFYSQVAFNWKELLLGATWGGLLIAVYSIVAGVFDLPAFPPWGYAIVAVTLIINACYVAWRDASRRERALLLGESNPSRMALALDPVAQVQRQNTAAIGFSTTRVLRVVVTNTTALAALRIRVVIEAFSPKSAVVHKEHPLQVTSVRNDTTGRINIDPQGRQPFDLLAETRAGTGSGWRVRWICYAATDLWPTLHGRIVPGLFEQFLIPDIRKGLLLKLRAEGENTLPAVMMVRVDEDSDRNLMLIEVTGAASLAAPSPFENCQLR